MYALAAVLFPPEDSQNVLAQASKSTLDCLACSIHGCNLKNEEQKLIQHDGKKKKSEWKERADKEKTRSLTNNSLGVFLNSGSFNKQLSTKSSAIFGNLPSGVNLGAGSFTICCSNSNMLIVIPPPCKLTPLLFLLSFFLCATAAAEFLDPAPPAGTPKCKPEMEPGRAGESVPSRSESSSSSSDSEKGKRPRASSISEMPRDQTSDLTVYWAPWIRSGYSDRSSRLGGVIHMCVQL